MLLLLPETYTGKDLHTADILSKAEMGSSLMRAHLEPDSRNISNCMTSPAKPGNEHLILRKQLPQ